ncbi:TPA: HINT domain-containing protein [Neisseria meningitidis]|uniref:HINT domain-containing protein n=1 Tax=Neisseria meningitidis TaxID=487 RepID=UPI000F450A99|nr:HINT domain-containing protein [Neisseria meningitidis]MBG8630199.1 pretoxin [Neisseria meningitidis]RNK28414.1 pretoxin [Neisseria meningitidis]
MVKTADGYKAIARIRAGESVLSKDEASGKTGYKPVIARYGNPYQETVYIEVSDGIGNNQTLISNRIHPFYSGGKWIKAEDLKAGSRLFAESGKTQTVRNIIVKPKPLKAYNLTVADWHTYFVKGNQAETEGVWVHNACPPKRTGSSKNGKHGDGGRSQISAESRIAELKNKIIPGMSKNERLKIKQKIRNIAKNANRKAEGEEHGRRGR